MSTSKMKPRFRRQRMDTEDSGDDWLLTYSDAVTLLMTFLVLLLSVSSIDQSKYEQAVQSIKEKGLDSDKKFISPFEALKSDLDQVTKDYDLKEDMTVSRQPKGVTIELASSTLYKVGSAEIQPAALEALQKVSEAIKDFKGVDYQVEIEGHTDNVAIHTAQFPSNWELSVNRATNIVRFLMQEGLDAQRMKAAGYADTKPKVPNVDANGNDIRENQAINRRVVINVIRKDS